MGWYNLNPQKALIFRIIHIDNVSWALDHGLHCKNSQVLDPNYVTIGNADLIDRRSHHVIKAVLGGTLSDYVPFYFTPFSPMFLNIKTGWNGIRQRHNDEIVILVSSLPRLKDLGVPFVFTDRHAVLNTAQFFTDLSGLAQIDWEILQQRDFKRDPEDPGKVERYEAEALIKNHVPIDALLGMICHTDSVARALMTQVEQRRLNLQVIPRPQWYFR